MLLLALSLSFGCVVEELASYAFSLFKDIAPLCFSNIARGACGLRIATVKATGPDMPKARRSCEAG